jgi:hypothetical protein
LDAVPEPEESGVRWRVVLATVLVVVAVGGGLFHDRVRGAEPRSTGGPASKASAVATAADSDAGVTSVATSSRDAGVTVVEIQEPDAGVTAPVGASD